MPDVRMLGPDGVEYDVPDDKVAEATQLGMKVHRTGAVGANEPGAPDSPFGLSSSGFKEGAKAGLEGFARGVLPGVVGGAKDIAMTPVFILKELLSTAEGAKNLATDPSGTLQKTISTLKGVPQATLDKLNEYADLARKNPEAFGNMVGNLTGAAETGIVAGAAAPLALKPVAGKVGPVLESTAKYGSFPIRIAGAHQVMSGNPAGLGLMFLPDLMKSGGAKLRDIGDNPSTLPNGVREIDPSNLRSVTERMTGKPAMQSIRVAPPTTGSTERIPYGGAEPAPYRSAAKAADKAEQLAAENEKRLKLIEDAAGEGKAGEPTITHAISADTPDGGKARMMVKIGEAAERTPERTFGKLTPDEVAKLRSQNYSDAQIARIGAEDARAVPMQTIRVAPPKPRPQTPLAQAAAEATQPTTVDVPHLPKIDIARATDSAPEVAPRNLKPGSTLDPKEMMADIRARVQGQGIKVDGPTSYGKTGRPIKLKAGPLEGEAKQVFDQYMKDNPTADPAVVEATLRKLSSGSD